MKKFFAVLCIALLVISVASVCKPPGVVCSSDADCCPTLQCNPWAGRCTKKPGPPSSSNPPSDPAEPPAGDAM
ncbi:uncharacterized protein LOC116427535 [Nomia melanderi]|uniref:uncharacterized protein LOC116427535 n=1 Tax=Nomia melanderi TaxID=2448451 RepID=UPI003FCCE1F1